MPVVPGLFDDEPQAATTPTRKVVPGLFDEPTTQTIADQAPAPTQEPSPFADETGGSPDEAFQNSEAVSGGFWKDLAAPFHDPDARNEIKTMGLPGAVASAAESIPVALTGLGTTPVQENPQASTAARLSEGIAGGIGRVALTGPLGPAAIGGAEAAAKAGQIATTEPEAFSERPIGTAARIGVAGAVPGASAKLAGAVIPAAAKAFSNPAAQLASGIGAGVAADLALTEAQKGTEYLGSTPTDEWTAEGFAQSLKPTVMDLATVVPGAVAAGAGAVRGARKLAGVPENNSTIQPEGQVIPDELPTTKAEGQTGGQIAPDSPSPEVIGQERPVINSSPGQAATAVQGKPVWQPVEGGRYHGTSKEIGKLDNEDPYFGSAPDTAQNLYGRGFYTTDDMFTAEGYTQKGKGGQPTMYKADWAGDKPPNLIDLEQPLPKDVQDALLEWRDKDFNAPIPDDLSGPGKKVYQQIREGLLGEQSGYADDVVEQVNERIAKLGYDGFKHVGGGRKPASGQAKPHNVEIYFDPQNKIKLTKLEQTTGGAPPQKPPVPPTAAGASQPEGSGDKYAGGFNKRLFGMDDKPGLQEVYETQAQRNPAPPKGPTRAEVAEKAKSIKAYSADKLAKIKDFDDARGMLPEERQALSDQTDYFANKRLEGTLSPGEQRHFDELSRVTKIARGAPGSDLALLNQNAIARYVEEKNYKGAALKVLDDMDPSGKAPEKAIKAIRQMNGDDPLEMARTVFRESRRYHGFLQNIITGNLLSNLVGTVPVNMASNVMNLAAETAGRKAGEYAPAIAGAMRGSKQAAKRTGFAAKEGFPMAALANPKLAAESPGFAAGGLANPFNWGGRAAFAGDEFIKGVAEQSHIDVMAKAQALEVHPTDKAARAKLESELKAAPTKAMLKESQEFAKGVSYQMEPDEASSALGRFINWAPNLGKGTRAEIKPIRVAIPFFKTVLNVAKANVKLSPIGTVGAVYKGARGKITPGQVVTQAAMGLIPTAIGVALAQNGMITGPIPKDPAEREAFFQAGERPWTIKWGKKRIPLAWAGPFALSLGLGAALKTAEDQQARGNIDEGAAELYAAASMNAFKLFMDGSPIITLNSVLQALTDPSEATAKKLASNVGSSLVPLVSLQGFLNRQNIVPAIRDPKLRDKTGETAFEDIMNNIVDRTLFSRTLPERVNQLGQTIDRPGQITAADPDPVYSEIYRLGVKVPQLGDRLTKLPGAAKSEKATGEEYREILKSGSPYYDLIRQQLHSPTWAAQPDDQKKLVLEAILGNRGLEKMRDAKRKEVSFRKLAGAVGR